MTSANSGTQNNKNCDVLTNKMWKDDIDSPQFSIGGGFRGVPFETSSQVPSMTIEESLDNMSVWDPKVGDGQNRNEHQAKIKENSNETKQQEFSINDKSDGKTSCAWYRDPIDPFANSGHVKPAIYNRDFCVLDCPHSLLNADELKYAVVLKLNKLVSDGFVDWDYKSNYTFQGRIYKKNEDGGFRITIYLLNEEKEDDESNECVLEVRRNGGDSFLFYEFKSKFLGLMRDDKSIINYEKPGEFRVEWGVYSLFDDDGDNILLSESEEFNNDSNNSFDANACVEEAINTKKYGVLRYRHCVAFLRNCSDNDIKLNKIMKVENVIDKLLIPINGNDKIYDALVIKSLLEVIYKIICKDISLASEDNQKTIKHINREWSKSILYSFSNIFPSQQIQWVTNKCIQKFANC